MASVCYPQQYKPATDSDNLNVAVNTPQSIIKQEHNAVYDTRTRENILAYFDELIAQNKIIVGQQCGDRPDLINDYYQEYVGRLAGKTNRYVGIIGADLGYFQGDNYPLNTLIDHWNEGGLVALSWHADNPFKEGIDAYWNTVENRDAIDLRALLKNSGESNAKSSYRREVDNIAAALQELKSAGVTVIWRPFHEMNGDYFWWGINAYNNQQTNVNDFKALWQDLYNTFTYDYGLDNLIWTYSVIPYAHWNAEVTAYYPGSDYVDLAGLNHYSNLPGFPNYKAMRSLGKTLVISETGPKDESYGTWDQFEMAKSLAGKAAYFLQWHSWKGAAVAIKDNRRANDMMNSIKVITRDEVLVLPAN
ncbi:glycoside hydrolase family 26 protein [Muriicola sp. Z0-33]|uniref:glycoside hydrolase family 26 protein n=1 Tax=Muriicola sp. Z0-33 TaxID=2816957 RepID=UPI0022378DC2|nr:glycoside hydrolase family 26 protein [Muriicola sp. Z0-33]MCW5516994.1 hypothetical protein [Muriicola sp. Z0-33]